MAGTSTFRSLAVAGAVLALCSAPAAATHSEAEAATALLGPRAIMPAIEMAPDMLAQSRLYCLTLAVYFEGGSTTESEEGQRHIARVIAERAKANRKKWGGAEICDVVFHKRAGVCQFSFACLPTAQRIPRGGPAWRYSLAIAQEEIEDKSNVQEHLIHYYMNPTLTSDRNACRFRKEFVPVVEAGRHQFFREPTQSERAELAATDPLECKRYTQTREASKRGHATSTQRLHASKRPTASQAPSAHKLKAKKQKYASRR